MLNKIDSKTMGLKQLDWLKGTLHFSYGNYYNPDKKNFGVVRALNDDIIKVNTGFDTHPHHNMEIISYVIDGKMTHKDDLGNDRTLSRGDFQYMSAGTGIMHSEHNHSDELLRIIHVWIYPDAKDYTPNYVDAKLSWDLRKNRWLHAVSSKTEEESGAIKINQDCNIYVLDLDENMEIDFSVDKGRQAYLVQIEGQSIINNIDLEKKDALTIIEEKISVKAVKQSHIILIEMGVNQLF